MMERDDGRTDDRPSRDCSHNKPAPQSAVELPGTDSSEADLSRSTIRIVYRKTDAGPEVVELREHKSPSGVLSPWDKYNGMFNGVPLWGGDEWKTESVESIVALFLSAADQVVEHFTKAREEAVKEHEGAPGYKKLWRKLTGASLPEVPSRESVIDEMVLRCRNLADWMSVNQHRRFYEGSDMSAYIDKPRAVAEALENARPNPGRYQLSDGSQPGLGDP